MSFYVAPSSGLSGVFQRTQLEGLDVQVVTDWDGQIVVPANKTGAIVHAQMQMVYPIPDDKGQGLVAMVISNLDGVVAQAGAHAGKNNKGSVGYYGSCTGVLSTAGTHQMSILIKVITGLDNANEFAAVPNPDPFFPGAGVVLDTGTPDDNAIGENPAIGRRVYFHFQHYVAIFY